MPHRELLRTTTSIDDDALLGAHSADEASKIAKTGKRAAINEHGVL